MPSPDRLIGVKRPRMTPFIATIAQYLLSVAHAQLTLNTRLTNLLCEWKTGTQSLPPPSLPQLVAEQHTPIPPTDKDSQRLIVVLSNASLETYKASHGGGSRANVHREDKYSLLNSDEHIGVMRKMNRDISDARPDITHQVTFSVEPRPVNNLAN